MMMCAYIWSVGQEQREAMRFDIVFSTADQFYNYSKQFKAYKSLEAHNQFAYGWVKAYKP